MVCETEQAALNAAAAALDAALDAVVAATDSYDAAHEALQDCLNSPTPQPFPPASFTGASKVEYLMEKLLPGDGPAPQFP